MVLSKAVRPETDPQVKCKHEYSERWMESTQARLDIFGINETPETAPLFVFIHGGYWQMGNRQLSRAAVPSLTRAGARVAVVGYGLAPDHSVTNMVTQIVHAIAYLNNWAARSATKGWYLCGHSAGGHLAVEALSRSEPSDLTGFQGVLLLSGVFDVRPFLGTTIAEPLGLTEEEATAISPILNVKQFVEAVGTANGSVVERPKVVVAVAGRESPVLADQSRVYATALTAAGAPIQLAHLAGHNHFSMVENLGDMDDTLTLRIMHWMGLKSPQSPGTRRHKPQRNSWH